MVNRAVRISVRQQIVQRLFFNFSLYKINTQIKFYQIYLRIVKLPNLTKHGIEATLMPMIDPLSRYILWVVNMWNCNLCNISNQLVLGYYWLSFLGHVRINDIQAIPPPQKWSYLNNICAMCWNIWNNNFPIFPNYIFWDMVAQHF